MKTRRARKRLDTGAVLASGLVQVGRGLLQLGGLAFLALTVSDKELRAAGGNVFRAVEGHRCGPRCRTHAEGKTAKERQRWWDERQRALDARLGELRERSGFPLIDQLSRTLEPAPPEPKSDLSNFWPTIERCASEVASRPSWLNGGVTAVTLDEAREPESKS